VVVQAQPLAQVGQAAVVTVIHPETLQPPEQQTQAVAAAAQ
jgi:hypothetical protein